MRRPPDKEVEPLLVRRRVRRKRRPVLERSLRALKLALVYTAAAALFLYLLTTALRPLLIDREEKAEVRRLLSAVEAAEAENERLRRRIQVLQTPKGIEVEARGHGWVRPGEVLIQTSEPPQPPRAGKPLPKPALGAVGGGEGLMHRFLDWLSEALGCRRPRAPAPTK